MKVWQHVDLPWVMLVVAIAPVLAAWDGLSSVVCSLLALFGLCVDCGDDVGLGEITCVADDGDAYGHRRLLEGVVLAFFTPLVSNGGNP